ncbi:hypothetical protein PVAG01_05687 [Phlyctema vagabunda]|uniref:Uncharacterized protein n=1 Tax=Phlyctema vagabunda TaxID=108571 RepID=A0ABR4PKU8_9HELO
MSDSSAPVYPLYNNSYTIFQVSPLHRRDTPLNNASLLIHAVRLREILVGGVLKGIEINENAADDAARSRAGALQAVSFRTLTEEQHWLEDLAQREQHPSLPGLSDRGILIEIKYEHAEHRAIMLRDISSDGRPARDVTEFERMPLFLARMPFSILDKVARYLALAFDTQIQNFPLARQFVNETVDLYIRNLMGSDTNSLTMDSSKVMKASQIIKDISITCGRPDENGELRTFDIHFKEADIPRYIARAPKDQQGPKGTPFLYGIHQYMYDHTAVDILHHRLIWEKVACSAFVIGLEKLRFTLPTDSNQRFASRQLLNVIIATAATHAFDNEVDDGLPEGFEEFLNSRMDEE